MQKKKYAVKVFHPADIFGEFSNKITPVPSPFLCPVKLKYAIAWPNMACMLWLVIYKYMLLCKVGS